MKHVARRLGHLAPFTLLLVLTPLACDKTPEPDASGSTPATPAAEQGPKETQAISAARPAPQPAAARSPAGGDPEQGEFTLDEALEGLRGDGDLFAHLETSLGTLECKLFSDRAPIAVANFVGLARGTRPWKNSKGEWVEEPAYDGTVFHRIIKGFMIQGGDPEGTGRGGPGYVFRDEVWEGAAHDRRGLLCMANRGPNTNGAQFFILDGPAPHLDASYTIFGECEPDALVEKLASVPVRGERPVNPPLLKRVTIRRRDARPPGLPKTPQAPKPAVVP